MPLVRTPMIAPTKIYDAFPALTPEQAARMVVRAVSERPKRIATRLGTFAEVSYALAPRLVELVQNVGFRLFPPSSGAWADRSLSTEGVAFAHLMRGIHF